MRPLPLRPAVFIPAWVALFAISTAASLTGPPLSDLAYTPTLLALLGVHIGWTWQAARYAAGILDARGESARARRFDLIASALAIVATAASVLLLISMPQGLSSAGPTVLAFAPVAVLLGALSAFALYATASMALCAAERLVGGGSPHALGTFIQFFYLPLALPWLHRRLARLNDAAPAPTVA